MFRDHTSDWRADRTCSHCGSMHPDDLFAAIEDGDKITPTDKSYKIYVRDSRKFYFQHLSVAEQDRFIELVNARRITFAYPGHFYVLPFFASAKV